VEGANSPLLWTRRGATIGHDFRTDELITSRLLRAPYVLVTDGFRRVEPPGADEFIGELERIGIVVGGRLARPVAAAWTGLAGHLIGAGKRS
jgi:hypothetical protein